MSEIIDVPMTAQRDIQTVTVEINVLHRQAQEMALSYAIQIGQRLKEAKAMLNHGEWGTWLENEVPFKPSTAQNFMRIFEEYGSNQTSLFGEAKTQTIGNLPYTKALKLLAIGDSDEREAFIEEHDVAGMSTRELEKAIRERDEAREEAENLKKRSEHQRKYIDEQYKVEQDLKQQLADAQQAASAPAEELEAERAKVTAAEKAVAEANAKLEAARAAEEKAKDAAKKAKADLKALRENPVIPDDTMAKMRSEAQEAASKAAEEKASKLISDAQKRAEAAEKAAKEAAAALEQTKRQAAAADPDTAVFKTYFSTVQEDFNRLHGVYLKIQQSDPDKADKLKAAMAALLQKMGDVWNAC